MKIKVYKYDPATDAAPYYIEHDVPWKEHMTVLEVITYVHEECEPVSFDYSCHGRQCGRCGLMMDGEPVLACSTLVKDCDHVIEPLKGMRVIRDLVVDRGEFDDRLSSEYARIRIEPVKAEEKNALNMKYAEDLYNLSNCTRCGICQAGCPIYSAMPDQYAGPAFMIALGFRHMDSYDQGDHVLEAVSKGLFHCIGCGKCDQVCPRVEIEHTKVFDLLKSEAEARGLKPSYAK